MILKEKYLFADRLGHVRDIQTGFINVYFVSLHGFGKAIYGYSL